MEFLFKSSSLPAAEPTNGTSVCTRLWTEWEFLSFALNLNESTELGVTSYLGCYLPMESPTPVETEEGKETNG